MRDRIEIWYGQLSLARRGTRKRRRHRSESGRIFALFASKTARGRRRRKLSGSTDVSTAYLPSIKRLGLRNAASTAFRLVKYSDGSIRTTWIYAQRSRQTRPDASREPWPRVKWQGKPWARRRERRNVSKTSCISREARRETCWKNCRRVFYGKLGGQVRL